MRHVRSQSAWSVLLKEDINKLHQLLEARKTELISHLHQTTQRKLKSLADQIETTHAKLSSCLEFVRRSLRTDHSQREVLMKTTIVQQVNHHIPTRPAQAQHRSQYCSFYIRRFHQGVPELWASSVQAGLSESLGMLCHREGCGGSSSMGDIYCSSSSH